MQPGQHRETARVLLHQNFDWFLLLKTRFDPEVALPARWITPGGGIDEGETHVEAAARELFEETGLRVGTESLGQKIGELSGGWLWGDGINHHTYVDHFYQLDITSITGQRTDQKGLTVQTFELDSSSWTPDEMRDLLEYRWWNVSELETTTELIGPPGLAELIRSVRDHQ